MCKIEISNEEIKSVLRLFNKFNLPLSVLVSNDQEYLERYVPKEFKERIEEIIGNNIDKKLNLYYNLEKIYRIDSNRLSYQPYKDIIVMVKRNLVKEKYPKLKFTKDNLCQYSPRSHICLDGFEYKNHYLIYEDIIRENSILVDFIRTLGLNWKKMNGKMDIKFGALISKHILGIKKTKRWCIELIHWFGPKNAEYLKKTMKKHLCSAFGAENSSSNNFLDKVDFCFSEYEKGFWNLEIEETIPIGLSTNFSPSVIVNDQEFKFYTRYVHAKLDKNLEKCFHLDLSIRSYENIIAYSQRTQQKIDTVKRNVKYQKLLRFDSEKGKIPFLELIGRYFYLNPYVLELFEGVTKSYYEIYPKRERYVQKIINELNTMLLESYCPIGT